MAPFLTILDKQITATLSCRPEGDSATQPGLFFLETTRNPVRASARFQQGPVRCFRSHQINSLFVYLNSQHRKEASRGGGGAGLALIPTPCPPPPGSISQSSWPFCSHHFSQGDHHPRAQLPFSHLCSRPAPSVKPLLGASHPLCAHISVQSFTAALVRWPKAIWFRIRPPTKVSSANPAPSTQVLRGQHFLIRVCSCVFTSHPVFISSGCGKI